MLETTEQMSADNAVEWVQSSLHWFYELLVAFASRSLGRAAAQSFVGNGCLIVLGLITARSAWYVLREVTDIGMKVLRVVLMLMVTVFMLSLLAELFRFVHPTEESRRVAQETVQRVATDAANQTSSWIFARLSAPSWRDLWQK